jgi:hypothetical protein
LSRLPVSGNRSLNGQFLFQPFQKGEISSRCFRNARSVPWTSPFSILFGVIGYLFRKFGYEAAPLILAFVLGPMLELNLRQTLIISKGSLLIFFTRPISAVTVAISIFILSTSLIHYFRRAKSL